MDITYRGNFNGILFIKIGDKYLLWYQYVKTYKLCQDQAFMVNSCSICLFSGDLELSKYLLYAFSIESMIKIEKAICVVKLSKTMSLLGLPESTAMKTTVFIPRARIFTLRMVS